jgi:uncharacterized protein
MDYAVLQAPLTVDEIDELDTWMDVSELHGYLTAIISGPIVMPSEWLSHLCAGQCGDRMTTLLMRLLNEIADALYKNPDGFEPLFREDTTTEPPARIAEVWCEGYIDGMNLRESEWQWLYDDEETKRLLCPIVVLGGSTEPSEELVEAVRPSAAAIYKLWRRRAQADRSIPATVRVRS